MDEVSGSEFVPGQNLIVGVAMSLDANTAMIMTAALLSRLSCHDC